MRVVRQALLWLSNVVVVMALFVAAGWALWLGWGMLPPESREMLRNPQSLGDATRRGLQADRRNPLDLFTDWLDEWLAGRRDLVDRVIAADGSSSGIVPLAEVARSTAPPVFGVTESLWQSRRARLSGARWSRVVFYWSEVQPRGPRDWRAGHYLQDKLIRRERANGVEVVGLLMNTPAWAAQNPRDGVRSIPAGLERTLNDPQNTWATFVRQMAREYRGRIDTWIIWNEPDITPGGPNTHYYSWAGDAADYARLLKTAYLAAKQGNPNAQVVFASTTYWADANSSRPLFLERTLDTLAADPAAPENHFFFDVAAVNLYASPDDLLRVHGVYRAALDRFGLSSTPLWITETNATPYDDPARGLTREPNGIRVTMDQQASYVIQASAMALAAGYGRLGFHAMTDRDVADELWGLVRNDGTLRPAFVAYQTVTRYFTGAQRVAFAGRERDGRQWPAGGYVPNWQVYLVVIDRNPEGDAARQVTSGQRVNVLWNGEPFALEVRLPRLGEKATVVDKFGRQTPAESDGQQWVIKLGPATAHSPLDPEGYFHIGGDPVLLVEDGVPPGAPVTPPAGAS